MILGAFTKRPTERKRYNVDYSIWLDDDEVLEDISFSVAPQTEPPFEVDEYHLANGRTVVFYVSGGLANTSYEVTLTAVTSKGDVEINSLTYNISAR